MTDTTAANPNKIKALELANQHTAEPAKVVERAQVYHAFLAGTAAPAAGATTGGATTTKATVGAGAGAGAGANKNAAGANNNKPDAAKAAADKKAAEKVIADKAAADKAAAAKPKADAAKGAPTGAAVPPDTKAPGGKNTYADVVNALRKVKDKSSKEDAVAILVEDGGGAKSVRDLKPALYDAVVEACNNVLEADGAEAAAGGQVEDPTAQPERDELGL